MQGVNDLSTLMMYVVLNVATQVYGDKTNLPY